MRLISNVSVLKCGQALCSFSMRTFPSDIRKVFGASSTAKGGRTAASRWSSTKVSADDLRYRLAQIHDALLRDARFSVGINMHTKGMTVAQAEEFFVKEAYQTPFGQG